MIFVHCSKSAHAMVKIDHVCFGYLASTSRLSGIDRTHRKRALYNQNGFDAG